MPQTAPRSDTAGPDAARPDAARHDAGSVDAARRLVRSLDGVLNGDGDAAQAAAMWLHAGAKSLILRGGCVEVDKIDCGAAGELLGRWPKLLSDAGVRAMQPRRDLSGASVAALRDALTADSAAAIRTLRRWIWAGGPFGIHLQLGPTLWQMPARLGYECPARQELDALRATAVARGVPREARAWPAATALLAEASGLSGVFTLRLAADDAASWIEDCLSAHEPMPDAVAADDDAAATPAIGAAADETARDAAERRPPPNPSHAAGVVRSQMGFGARLELEALWDGLHKRNSPFASELKEALPVVDAGRIVGRSMPLDAARVQRIADLLEAGSDFAAGVASGLLLRAVDARAVEGMSALLKRLGLQRVWQLANLTGIGAKSAKGLALVLKKLDAGPTLWADLVGAAPPTIAAWILRGSPPHILSRVGGQLRAKLISQPPAETAPLVRALVAMDAVVPLRAVGEALRETGGAGWSGQLVPAVCAALLKHGMGEELLIPIFLDRSAETSLRLLVLRSLDSDLPLLEIACRFRLGELVEPKQIQARLKAARKNVKARK